MPLAASAAASGLQQHRRAKSNSRCTVVMMPVPMCFHLARLPGLSSCNAGPNTTTYVLPPLTPCTNQIADALDTTIESFASW